MSRSSNHDKPFYVDVGTSIVAIRCSSNHDVVERFDYIWHPYTLELAKERCDRMNREVEIVKPLRNCDVGTAREQYERFRDMCFRTNCEGLVKHDTLSEYAFEWSQMPYKKEGKE